MRDRVTAVVRASALPLLGLVATYAVFVLTPLGRRFDLLALHGRLTAGWHIRRADVALLDLISVSSLAVVLGVLVIVAVARGRWRTGLGAVAAVLGSLLMTEVFKYALPSKTWGGAWRYLTADPMGSFPSGHSVIVASVALAVLAVSSDRWRRFLVGPLAAWVVVTTTATVTIGWHRPSDVIGSLFLATAWHRGIGAAIATPAQVRDRAVLSGVTAFAWWALGAFVVLGAAAHGILNGAPAWYRRFGPLGAVDAGRLPEVAYFLALGLLVVAGGVMMAASSRSGVPPRRDTLTR